jgi:hypothetical protein
MFLLLLTVAILLLIFLVVLIVTVYSYLKDDVNRLISTKATISSASSTSSTPSSASPAVATARSTNSVASTQTSFKKNIYFNFAVYWMKVTSFFILLVMIDLYRYHVASSETEFKNILQYCQTTIKEHRSEHDKGKLQPPLSQNGDLKEDGDFFDECIRSNE